MFIIGEAVIEESIAHERFACDLGQCKGACCTLPGGRGAPLEDSETEELERVFPHVKKYLSLKHRLVVEELGLFEGSPGTFATTCIEEKDCVFVFYEGGVAKCAIETAHDRGEVAWRKPLSCHLFPIRVSESRGERLRYSKITECNSAVKHGKREGIPLYEFLAAALIRKFGDKWYQDFLVECRRLDGAVQDASRKKSLRAVE